MKKRPRKAIFTMQAAIYAAIVAIWWHLTDMPGYPAIVAEAVSVVLFMLAMIQVLPAGEDG